MGFVVAGVVCLGCCGIFFFFILFRFVPLPFSSLMQAGGGAAVAVGVRDFHASACLAWQKAITIRSRLAGVPFDDDSFGSFGSLAAAAASLLRVACCVSCVLFWSVLVLFSVVHV